MGEVKQHCENCKNYEAKEKPPRVTVLTFDRDGKQGSYSFAGKPDWARIERETIGAGMMAVIVKNGKTTLEGVPSSWDHQALYSLHLPLGYDAACRHAPEMDATLGTRWDYHKDFKLGKAIARIQSAIAEWREKQPKPAPEHYDGEPYTGEIQRSRDDGLDGKTLVYTGEKALINEPPYRWYVSEHGWAFHGYSSGDTEPRWILRAVPVEPPKPEWKKGDYAFDTARDDYGIVVVGDVWNEGVSVWVKSLATNLNRTAKYADLRPLTPADWTREIGGVKVKVRAYESDNGIHMYEDVPGEGFDVHYFPNKAVAREFCRLANLPVMPYALHKGEMDPPE